MSSPPSLSCPLCSASLAPSALEAHLRFELDLPLAKCRLCPRSFCDEAAAEKHFAGPFAKHPGAIPQLLQPPDDEAKSGRLLELLRLARGGPEAVQQRLCVCGQCRLLCREDFRPASAQAFRDLRPASGQAYRDFRPPSDQAYRDLRPASGQEYRDIRPASGSLEKASAGHYPKDCRSPSDDEMAGQPAYEFTTPAAQGRYEESPQESQNYHGNLAQRLTGSEPEDMHMQTAAPEDIYRKEIDERASESLSSQEAKMAAQEAQMAAQEAKTASEEEAISQDVKPELFGQTSQLAADGKVACLQCQKRVERNGFSHHVQWNHIEGKPFQCLLCPVSAKMRSELVKHQRKAHDCETNDENSSSSLSKDTVTQWIKLCFGETKAVAYRGLTCKACGVSVMSHKLKPHIAKAHLKKPLYKCRACDFVVVTTDVNNMNTHVRKSHGLAPGPETVDSAGLRQYAPIIKAMIPQLFDKS